MFGDKHSNQLFFYLAQQNYAKLFLYPIIMGDKVTLGNFKKDSIRYEAIICFYYQLYRVGTSHEQLCPEDHGESGGS